MAKIEWLKSEVEKRYTNGFHSLTPLWGRKICKIREREALIYDSFDDKLFIKGMVLGGLIYYDGQWANPAKIKKERAGARPL